MFQTFNMLLVPGDIANADGLQVQHRGSFSGCPMGVQSTHGKGSMFWVEMGLTDELHELADPAGFSATPLTPIHAGAHKPAWTSEN